MKYNLKSTSNFSSSDLIVLPVWSDDKDLKFSSAWDKVLKEFFSESMTTTSGEEISTIEIKKILEKIILDENKRKPETDERLVKILNEKGYKIARRTVAKYREQLNIPVARLRKEI